MTRIDRIRLLIATRHDLEFAPETNMGRIVRRQSLPGQGPSKTIPCPVCGGSGVVKNKWGAVIVCETCNIRGRITVDGYTGEQVQVANGNGNGRLGREWVAEFLVLCDRDSIHRLCDRCAGEGAWKGARCEVCDGRGRVAVPGSWVKSRPAGNGFGSDGDAAVLAACDRREKAGSYRELDRALADLRRAFGARAVELLDTPTVELSEGALVTVDLLLVFVDQRMPDPVRVPSWAVKNEQDRCRHRTVVRGRQAGVMASARRDREIRALARDGQAVQWIAAEYGVSVRLVYEIVRRQVS